MFGKKAKQPSWISEHFEALVGITIALVTACFAMNNLAGGIYEANEVIYSNEKAATLNWHNDKSIKETLVESEINMLNAFIDGGSLSPEMNSKLNDRIRMLSADIVRYNAEQVEILQGSANIPQAQWSQDIDGELGKVVGAFEYEALVEQSAHAGDYTDLATLFYELALVLGGICLLFQKAHLKKLFYGGVLLFGAIALWNTSMAYAFLWPFS